MKDKQESFAPVFHPTLPSPAYSYCVAMLLTGKNPLYQHNKGAVGLF